MIGELNKILNKLAELDANYLLDYPKKMSSADYVQKRQELRSRCEEVKNNE